MGLCREDVTSYLRNLGYNAVRHPDSSLRPLAVIGQDRGECSVLGQIEDLVDAGSVRLPSVSDAKPAADLVGRRSSAVSIRIGASVLGAFVGAMGGTLGGSIEYTNARIITFEFSSVTKVGAIPAQVGSYVGAADISFENPVLVPWVAGRGRIHIVVEVALAREFNVTYERSAGLAAKVDVDALTELAGAGVQVSADKSEANRVSFAGAEPLGFAFKCFELGYIDGRLALTRTQPAAFALSDAFDENGEPISPGEVLADVHQFPLIEFVETHS